MNGLIFLLERPTIVFTQPGPIAEVEVGRSDTPDAMQDIRQRRCHTASAQGPGVGEGLMAPNIDLPEARLVAQGVSNIRLHLFNLRLKLLQSLLQNHLFDLRQVLLLSLLRSHRLCLRLELLLLLLQHLLLNLRR